MGCTARRNCPPQQIQDLKCGAVEKKLDWCTNPAQLMVNIPKLVPIANRALQPTTEEGAFKLAEEADKMMYEANWNELFNLTKTVEDGEKAAVGAAHPLITYHHPVLFIKLF